MIRLLALDLDGTTLDSRGVVSDRTRQAIRSAEDAGVLVSVATGRRFRDARPVGLDLELNAPMITHNGGLIKYAEGLETVQSSLLSTDTSLEAFRVGRSLGGDPLVSTDPHGHGVLIYDRVSDDNLPLRKYLVWAENLHGEGTGHHGVEHVESLEEIVADHEVVHISFSGTCERMNVLAKALRSELGDVTTLLETVYEHLDFTLLDILPPGVSKGHAVASIAQMNGFAAKDVMVIGDNFNDLEMLEYAGTPVVMGNADPKLHERGDFYTTLTNDEDGVAAAIDRFILN
jgi:hydroxymethylpyrimidine pyrophosphatase-like HAD family hydrolase